MSFILDALKKADRRRPEGDVPDLNAEHFAAKKPPVRRDRMAWLLISLLILNALAFGGLYYYLTGPEELQVELNDDAVPAAVDNTEGRSPVPARTPKEAPAEKPVRGEPDAEPILPQPAARAEPPSASAVLKTSSEAETEAKPAAGGIGETPQVAPPPAAVGEPEAAPPAFRALEDLPPAIRAELPEFDFSMHSFTREPENRLVRVNGRILRESQALQDGLVLREVTAQGAVFSYRGYTFEVSGF